MGCLKFGSWDEEAKDIKSGKIRKIVREVDCYDPRFKELEDINLIMVLDKHKYSLDVIGLDEMRFSGHKNHLIYIEGDCDEQFLIKKISYKDGFVIIEW